MKVWSRVSSVIRRQHAQHVLPLLRLRRSYVRSINGKKSYFLNQNLSTMSHEKGLVGSKKKAEVAFDPSKLSLAQRLNLTTGKMEWVELPEDYDYHQEIARSAYADMLHDHDRNMKYLAALKIAIDAKHAKNEKAVVLDIGTGTGLLSMMAALLGADEIYACEAFTPMAECASKVITRNGLSHKIKLIPKRSTELCVGGEQGDLPTRANILVTEVFDTELIGEGAIFTFNHANEHLLSDDAIVIPESAVIYAMVVDCPLIATWNTLPNITVPNGNVLTFPPKISKCGGISSVHDLQMSEISPDKFTAISDPIPVFKFYWNAKTPVYDTATKEYKALNSGTGNAVFCWWDLKMDSLGENVISCQPNWIPGKNVAWRDHWMQFVYHIPETISVSSGEDCSIVCCHDEYSLGFTLSKKNTSHIIQPLPSTDVSVCDCGFHVAFSRSRVGLLNEFNRNQAFMDLLSNKITPGESVCVCISDGSLLPLFAGSLGAKKVFAIESSPQCARVLEEFIQYNGLNTRIKVLSTDVSQLSDAHFENLKIDVIIGDPFFTSSIFPWNDLAFWYQCESLKDYLSPNCCILPSKAELYAVAVNFEELWKIKSPVRHIWDNKLDLADFDNLIAKSSSISDDNIDVQPLWEYHGTASSLPCHLMSFDFQTGMNFSLEKCVEREIEVMSSTNGIAFWMNWTFGNEITLSNGPVQDIVMDSKIYWNINRKQGVLFARFPKASKIFMTVTFEKASGNLVVTFNE